MQVGADMVRVMLLLLDLSIGVIALRWLQHQQGLILRHIAARQHQQLPHHSGGLRIQHMLHFHGFQNAKLCALGYLVTLCH